MHDLTVLIFFTKATEDSKDQSATSRFVPLIFGKGTPGFILGRKRW